MRYYFDFKDHFSVMDKRGEVCTTQEAAEDFAKKLAGEMGQEKSPADRVGDFIVVVDETGTEVFRTPLTDG